MQSWLKSGSQGLAYQSLKSLDKPLSPSTAEGLYLEGGSRVGNARVAGGTKGLSVSRSAQRSDGNGGGGRGSLDSDTVSARNLERRIRRLYHRIFSGVERKGALKVLTLTSSPCSGDIHRAWRLLRLRLKRRGFTFQYLAIKERTKSGLVHLHVVLRGNYIPQRLISRQWDEVHGAPVVWITKIRSRSIARYLAKYLSKESQGRFWYSQDWMRRGWRAVVKMWWRLSHRFMPLGWWRAWNRGLVSTVDLLVYWWRYPHLEY